MLTQFAVQVPVTIVPLTVKTTATTQRLLWLHAVPQWNHSESYYTVQQRNHYNCIWSWWYSGKLSQMSDQGQLTLKLQLVFSTYINQVKTNASQAVLLQNSPISFFGVVSVVVWGYSYNLYWVSASTVRFDHLWYLKKHSTPRRWSIHICL